MLSPLLLPLLLLPLLLLPLLLLPLLLLLLLALPPLPLLLLSLLPPLSKEGLLQLLLAALAHLAARLPLTCALLDAQPAPAPFDPLACKVAAHDAIHLLRQHAHRPEQPAHLDGFPAALHHDARHVQPRFELRLQLAVQRDAEKHLRRANAYRRPPRLRVRRERVALGGAVAVQDAAREAVKKVLHELRVTLLHVVEGEHGRQVLPGRQRARVAVVEALVREPHGEGEPGDADRLEDAGAAQLVLGAPRLVGARRRGAVRLDAAHEVRAGAAQRRQQRAKALAELERHGARVQPAALALRRRRAVAAALEVPVR